MDIILKSDQITSPIHWSLILPFLPITTIPSLHTSQYDFFNPTFLFNLSLTFCPTNGPFKVILWVKRGEVLDQGVDQPNNGLPYNAETTKVESGNLNHHIVRLFPMEPENLDLTEFEALKFDVHRGLRI